MDHQCCRGWPLRVSSLSSGRDDRARQRRPSGSVARAHRRRPAVPGRRGSELTSIRTTVGSGSAPHPPSSSVREARSGARLRGQLGSRDGDRAVIGQREARVVGEHRDAVGIGRRRRVASRRVPSTGGGRGHGGAGRATEPRELVKPRPRTGRCGRGDPPEPPSPSSAMPEVGHEASFRPQSTTALPAWKKVSSSSWPCQPSCSESVRAPARSATPRSAAMT